MEEENTKAIIIKPEEIQRKILIIRGIQVILDRDLAVLYGVSTKRLNEQVQRNRQRFPKDFMFKLKKKDFINLRSQFATSSSEYGGVRWLPYAFAGQQIVQIFLKNF
jgi:hypothetical protein